MMQEHSAIKMKKKIHRYLNVSNVTVSRESLCSEFHVSGPRNEKDPLPNIFNINAGVTNNFESVDDLK